ncbi:dynamin family protein [Paenisporosarcina sp.]|uniref:dynamin family protein n=1 Tax=Paenisporosarcina sp. TaxID=1932001 RepID=UPI003C74818C
MKSIDSKEFLQKIQQIKTSLEQSKPYILEAQVVEFQNSVKKLQNNLDDIIETERSLQIGIIGEVKAGKSSFINSLIFNGKEILPKAPTPMTAALTKISYGEQFEAKIVFYDEDDWRIIEANAERADRFLIDLFQKEQEKLGRQIDFNRFKLAKKDAVPKEYAGCKELIEMIDKNQLVVQQHIGQTKRIQAHEQEQFIDELNQYVGSGGLYTPLVKYTDIKLNNEALRNIEIVDTPGMNDPIVSRTIVTSDFLMSCDVVFFLSYAGQFLTQEEMALLTRSLPENSIGHAYLIASKFDSAILDYSKPLAPITKAVNHTMNNITNQAENIFKEYRMDPNAPLVLKSIAGHLPPHCSSGLLFTCAMKIHTGLTLNEDEEHILSKFESRFEGFTRSPKELMRLANILPLRQKVLGKVKEEKNEIIQERAQKIVIDQNIELLRLLRHMEEQARSDREDLLYSDVAGLQTKVEQISEKLGKIRKNVSGIFTNSHLKAARILHDIKIDVEKEINNHSGVKVEENISHSSGTRRTGFLGLNKEGYTVTTTTYTAQVTEVVSSIRKYVTRSKEMINNEFKRLFDIQELKKEISEEVIGAFDLVSNEFNEGEIKRALEIALNRLSVQEIVINQEKYDKKITSKFSQASVKNDQIAELQLEQERLLVEVAQDINNEISNKMYDIEFTLEKYAANFIDDIEQQLITNTNKIKAMLEDKESNLKQLDAVITQLNQYKKLLS